MRCTFHSSLALYTSVSCALTPSNVHLQAVEVTIQNLIGSGMDPKTENNPYLGFIYTSFQVHPHLSPDDTTAPRPSTSTSTFVLNALFDRIQTVQMLHIEMTLINRRNCVELTLVLSSSVLPQLVTCPHRAETPSA